MPRATGNRWTIATRPIYSSSNPLGIPDLRLQEVELPTRTALKQEESGPGAFVLDRTMVPAPGSTVGFFVDDYRIEPLWSTPQLSLKRLALYRPAALIEPDFSQFSDHPRALAVWNLYRSRWLARWWQTQGLTVIPSLNWTDQTLEVIGYGIPQGSVVACEARPRFKDADLLLAGLREAIRQIQPRAVLMYGAGPELREQVPAGPEYVWLPAWSPRKRMAALPEEHFPGIP